MNRDTRDRWHRAINAFMWEGDKPGWTKDFSAHRFMYEAKELASEVPRLTLLHKMERCGELTPTHRHCSRSPAESVPDNHLTCCLGVKCRECPELKALDAMDATPVEIDEAKAWTCAAHIVSKGGDVASEGYVLTVDDRMFWDRTYASMAQSHDPDDDASGERTPREASPDRTAGRGDARDL